MQLVPLEQLKNFAQQGRPGAPAPPASGFFGSLAPGLSSAVPPAEAASPRSQSPSAYSEDFQESPSPPPAEVPSPPPTAAPAPPPAQSAAVPRAQRAARRAAAASKPAVVPPLPLPDLPLPDLPLPVEAPAPAPAKRYKVSVLCNGERVVGRPQEDQADLEPVRFAVAVTGGGAATALGRGGRGAALMHKEQAVEAQAKDSEEWWNATFVQYNQDGTTCKVMYDDGSFWEDAPLGAVRP